MKYLVVLFLILLTGSLIALLAVNHGSPYAKSILDVIGPFTAVVGIALFFWRIGSHLYRSRTK